MNPNNPPIGITLTETLTIRGFVGSDVRTTTTSNGLTIANFRFGSTPRRFDRSKNEWTNGETNWFNVSCFRGLAANTAKSVAKGDPLIITGKLKIRNWENDAGARGTSVDVEAEALGHDLSLGTDEFSRTPVSTSSQGSQNETGGSESWDSADQAQEGEPPF